MFWKGPVFSRDGFKGVGLNLESSEIAESMDGVEDGVIATRKAA